MNHSVRKQESVTTKHGTTACTLFSGGGPLRKSDIYPHRLHAMLTPSSPPPYITLFQGQRTPPKGPGDLTRTKHACHVCHDRESHESDKRMAYMMPAACESKGSPMPLPPTSKDCTHNNKQHGIPAIARSQPSVHTTKKYSFI